MLIFSQYYYSMITHNSELFKCKTNSPLFIYLLDTKMLNRHFKFFKIFFFNEVNRSTCVSGQHRLYLFTLNFYMTWGVLQWPRVFVVLSFFFCFVIITFFFFCFWLMVWNGLCVSMLGRYFIQKCLPQICVNVWCSLDYCKVFSGLSVEACDVS